MKHSLTETLRQFCFKFALLIILFAGSSSLFGQSVDCSIAANCNNPYCQDSNALRERGCECFDTSDNDGDGKIDKADPDCATYYGLSFIGTAGGCSITPPGTPNPFDMMGAPAVSGQNTADTQSKVSVGDVDGDGMPDAIITSKWNSEIRVVATSNGQADGSDAGDIKSDFKTTGQGASIFSGTGGCDPKNLLFEHENLIADIDGDGTGELFAIVSNRGGNPKTPPTCFFLLSLEYAPDDLVPMYNPVIIGSDRPGTFGIADMDGDGKAELYMRDRIYAAETGKLLATGNGNWDLDVTSAPVAVNVTGDNRMELVCGTKIYSIPNLSNRNPAAPQALTLVSDMNTLFADKCYVKLMIDPVEYGQDTHSSCSVADVDGDGAIDIIISGALNSVTGKTAVFYWNVAKNTSSYYLPPDGTYADGWPWGTGRVNIGDANGDGKLDFSFIAGNRLFCLTTDAAGTTLVPLWATFRTINDSRSGVLTVSIYDFNNDGNPEMVYRDSQELVVIDGATGQTRLWSAVCQSHTYTEGPVIADVNGDGATDICVACNRNNSFNINADIQQQALGEVRLFFSSGNEWLPTRKVWNQPGYFVVNINDDLTLPFPQIDQTLDFGDASTVCDNGNTGIQNPLNLFLNQVPYMNSDGCPIYPGPDLTFYGDDPDTVDINNPPIGYNPAVIVTPPICGDLDIDAVFNIINVGSLPISYNVPVSFYNGDPRVGTTATLLFTSVLNIVNLQVDSTYTSPSVTFNGPGTVFDLHIVLNNDGTRPLPLSDPDTLNTVECRLASNFFDVTIAPDPFTARIEKIKDNYKCDDAAPNDGELRVRIFKGAAEVLDYSPYSFQWYTGPASSPVPIAGATNYNITSLDSGTYTVIATNTLKGCSSIPVDTTIVRLGNDPDVSITVISDQTQCNPPNGQLQASIVGGNAGFTFEWYDIALNPQGITGPIANNLIAGNYFVRVTKDGCIKDSPAETVDGPQEPDAIAQVDQHIVNCINPNSGSISADATFNLVIQNPANYTFDWYYYDNATSTRGSILPPAFGAGRARTGLPVGYYQVEIREISTQCLANQSPIVQIMDQTVLPTAFIDELAPQTSCNPADPNGRLSARVQIAGVDQPPGNFTFTWFKGDNTLPANQHNSVSGVNGSIAEDVAGGGVFYTVRVTTSNNCSDTEKRIITDDLNNPVVTLTTVNNGICDPALASSNYNGSVTASVTFDGVAVTDFTNYQITWHDGSLTSDPVIPVTTTTLPQRDGGFYTVVVERTDLSCVSNPVTAEVLNVTTLPVISTNAVASTSCDPALANGQAQVTNVDGAGTGVPYTFQWHTGVDISSPIVGATNPNVTNVQGGVAANYTVRVTNTNSGCRNTATVQVPDARVLPLLTLTPAPNSICNPALTSPAVTFNGTVAATVTNQIGLLTDYVFTWRNGSLVTDPVNASSTNQNLGTLNGGFYTVTSRHTLTGCISDPVTAQVLNTQVLPAITTNAVASTSCDPALANGQAQVTDVDGAGVAAPYIFQWHTGNDTSAPIGAATNANLTGRQGGVAANFTVLVTNQNSGCQNTQTVQVPDARVLPLVTLTPAPNSICNPALTSPAVTFNGTVAATVTNQIGLLTDYVFTWRNGSLVTDPVNGSSTNQNLGTLNGGFYTVTSRHTLTGCISDPVTAQVLNTQVLPAITTNAVASTSCDPALANGQAQVTDVDGAGVAAPYIFQWHTGNDTSAPIGAATNANLTGRQGGVAANFTVLVTNQNSGCQNTQTVQVPDARVLPLLTLTPAPNSICNPALTSPAVTFNGTVAATVTNQIGLLTDYVFTWRNGALVTDPVNGSSTNQNLGTLNGGFYTVTSRHTLTGCISDPVTAQVLNTQVLPAITTNAVASTSCDPALANGQAQVTDVDGAGVAAPYIFQWHTGNDTSAPIGAATNANLTGRQGGVAANFTVLVTNQNSGCQNTQTVQVPDARVLPLLTLTPAPNSICNPALTSPAVTFNGTVAATVTNQIGLLTDYVFTWRNGALVTDPVNGSSTNQNLGTLNGGFYTVTSRHAPTGCISDPITAQVLNTQVLPAITTNAVASTNCIPALANGQAQVTDVDGAGVAAPYIFQWHTGNDTSAPIGAATNANLTGRQGGVAANFTVLVTNQNSGCQNTQTVQVPDARVLPVVTLSATDNTICAGVPDGTATINTLTYQAAGVAFPYAGYTFNWSTGAVTSSITQRAAGFYTLTVTRTDVGCTSDPATIEVKDNFTYPVILMTPTPQTSCDVANLNGEIAAAVDEGGVPVTNGYTYSWFDGNGLATPLNAANVDPGNPFHAIDLPGNVFYTLRVVNNVTQCDNTRSIFLQEIIALPRIELVVTDIADCNTPGSIMANIFIDTNNDGVEDPLPAGGYVDYDFSWHRGSSTAAPQLVNTTVRQLQTLDNGITPIPVGNYTAFVTNTITNCISPDVTALLNGPPPLFDIDINVNFRPASCATDEGVITAYINNAGVPTTAGFTFEWYQGSITNGLQNPPPSFYTDPPVAFNGLPLDVDFQGFYGSVTYPVGQPLPDHQAPTGVTTGPTLYGKASGTYTVVATRADGCKEYLTAFLPYQDEPVIIVADIKPDECGVDVGEISVDITVPGASTPDQYKIWLIPGANPVLTPPGNPATPITPINPAAAVNNTFTGLGPGIYTVVAQEDPLDIFSGCFSSPVQVQMQEALPPLLDMTAAAFSTSCGVAPGDGSLEIHFETDPSDPFSPTFPVPPPPITYNPGPQTYTVDVEDSGGAPVFSSVGNASGTTLTVPNLRNGDFDVTITSSQGCSITKTFTVPWDPQVAQLVNPDVVFQNALYCNPLLEANARVEVQSIAIIGGGADVIGDYRFDWYTDIAMTLNVYGDDGETGAAIGGEVFQNGVNGVAAGTVTARSYWVVAEKVDAGATGGVGCTSAPFKVDIEDQSVDPVFTLTPSSNTACDANFEGSLLLNVTNPGSVATATYTYDWDATNPTDIEGGLGPVTANDDGVGLDDNPIDLQEGTYRVIVTNNATGCPTTGQATILKTETPIVIASATPVDQVICNPDGSITVVDVTINGVVDATHTNFDFTWYRNDLVAAPVINAANGVDVLNVGNLPTISAGTYFVKAKRVAGLNPGSGCESAPLRVDIQDVSEDPVFTLTPFSNTACDANFEGSLLLNVTDPGSAPTVNYTYDWDATNPTDIEGGLGPVTGNDDGVGLDDNPIDLQDGTYRVIVTNNASGCTTAGQATILRTETPIVIATATPVDQVICNPDGSITVVDVTVNGVVDATHTNFDFTWYRNDLVAAPVINAANGVDVLNVGNLPTISAGTYFVKAKRITGLNPGSGCESAPLRVDIQDVSIDPVFTLTPFSNTACDANFEGSLLLNVTDPGSAPTATYTYDWDATNPIDIEGGLGPVTANDDGAGLDDNPIDLQHGTYRVIVTNNASGCTTAGQATIVQTETPIVIATATPIDQAICYPDGSITVNDITVDGIIDPTHTNFDFTWYKTDLVSAPVINAVNGVDVLNVGNMPTIGAGTYFVKVKRLTGMQPGSGCESAPLRVDIQDVSVDPRIQFTFQPNSSCDPVNPNGVILADASETDGTNTDTYNFTWTFNGGAIPGVTTQTTNSNSSQLADAYEGNYVLTIVNFSGTGCQFTANLPLALDLNISLPNIVTVDTNDPLDCLGSGDAEVTAISIGGGPAITGAPLATDFSYEWFQGNVLPASQLPTTTPLLSNLNPGTFYVLVRDLQTQCKSTPTEVTILDDDIVYPDITIDQTALQISCGAGNTAALSATADGQNDTNLAYSFTWFNNLTTTAPSFAATSAISGLVTGNYSVSVTNSTTGCTATDVYIIMNDSPEFMPHISLSSQPRINCLVPDGALLAREVGFDVMVGYPFPSAYTAEVYAGANPDLSQPGIPMTIIPGFQRNWFDSNFDIGTFTVKITDTNTDCFVSAVATIADGRVAPVVAIVQENPLINCDPARPNGQLSATADNGQVGGYTFQWYNGSTVSGAPIPSTNKLVGQINGTFTVRVTNNTTGCFDDESGVIQDGRLDAPMPTAELIQDRTHCLIPDGWVSAHVNNNIFNYYFDWYDGASAQGAPDFRGASYTNRDVGPYTVIAIDIVTGCDSPPVTIAVSDSTVIPELYFITTPSFCDELPSNPGGSGTIEVQFTPATIVSDSITWIDLSNNTEVGNGSYITGLLPGSYQADVITTKGCYATNVALVGTEILAYNLVSVNGDQKNDVFKIDCITRYPNNNVKIFNRSGVLVYEADGYNNDNIVFTGIGEKGIYAAGNQLPVGTYFYIIDKRDGSKPRTGYLELVK